MAQYQLPVVTFDAALTPAKAGTKNRPKASRIRLDLKVAKEPRATADQLVFHLPEHVRVSGTGFRYCPSTRLNTMGNPKRCPKGSRGKKATTGFVSRSGTPYGQKITVDVPAELQKHLGTSVYLTRLNVTVGGSNGRRAASAGT